MKKFAVVSGFLGAGKTSVMMALTKRWSERFAPADDCTRAQIVTFLYRALEQA